MKSPVVDAIPPDIIRAQSRTLRLHDGYTQGIVDELLDEFEANFPQTYSFMMGGAKALEKFNWDMSNLAADIGFDIYVTYRNFYKDRLRPERDKLVPSFIKNLTETLKRLLADLPRQRPSREPQKEWLHWAADFPIQPHLINHIISEVDRYISFKKERRCAQDETKTHLVTLVVLFERLIANPPAA